MVRHGIAGKCVKPKRNVAYLLGGILAAQFLLIAAAGESQAQTFSEALVTTYETNPSLRAARANLRAVDEGVAQALSNWRPDLRASAFGGLQYTDTDSEFFSDSGDSQPRGGDVELVQPLYRGGRTVSETREAELNVLAERSNLSNVEQGVFFEASVAYLDVWRDQSVLELNRNNERVLRRQLEASQDRFEVGEITRTDVAQSESRLARATAERIAAEGALSSSRAVFQRVVGVYPAQLERPPALGEMPSDLDRLIEISQQQDPRVLASQYREQSARQRVDSVSGEFLPSAQLRGNLSYVDDQGISKTQTTDALLIAELNVPLYQKGLVSSRTREAKQLAFRASDQVDETLVQAREDATEAWEALLTARAQIRSFEVEVEAAQIALEGVREENLVGERTVLDVLDAEQELLDAQVSLVRVQRDGLVANYAVLQAMGRLTASSLGLEVQVYDPEENYEQVRDRWFGTDVLENDN